MDLYRRMAAIRTQDDADELLDEIYAPLEGLKEAPDAELVADVNTRLINICNIARTLPGMTMSEVPPRSQADEAVRRIFAELREDAGPMYGDILRYFLLNCLDTCWKEHLRAMDYLREGIGLQGYGQRDPKREYQKQGLDMFKAMLFRIHQSAIQNITHVHMQHVDAESEAADIPEEGAPLA